MPFIAQELGVSTQQLPDFCGLAGISSSKIPGVVGIGPKSASQLLAQAGTLEQLYQQLDTVPEKWRRKLESQREMAFVSRQVATLRKDLTLEENLQQLRLTAGK